MLNYFRSKNKLVDKIYIQSVTEEAFLRQIRELQEKNKNLHSENARLRGLRDYSNRQELKTQELQKEKELLISKNHKLSGDLGKAFSDICDLQGKIKQLEAENLGLLNKITNDDKFHDPDLRIDLTKPIRNKFTLRPHHITPNNRSYTVHDIISDEYTYYQMGNHAARINEDYENYEPDVKPVAAQEAMNNAKEGFKDFGAKVEETLLKENPLSVKNIVPKKENEYAIIDMTKKSKAVRAFLKMHTFKSNSDINQIYKTGISIMSMPNCFTQTEFDRHEVTKDNIRKMMKEYIDAGLVNAGKFYYTAAKPLKIILEKENGTA